MPDYSSSLDSLRLRRFRGRDFPRLPSLPNSELNGKEGVDGSSPSEGLPKSPANWHFALPMETRFQPVAGLEQRLRVCLDQTSTLWVPGIRFASSWVDLML
jgi:hypothetical protein